MREYQIIYADPPWQQTKGGLRKVRPNQSKLLDYPTMQLTDIRRVFEIFNAPILFVWTIDKFLWDCENMFADYKLHARFVWDKENGIAPAFTVRFAHEYLLWFYKRPMLAIAKNMRGKYTTVLREKASLHSKKPVCARRMIEKLYPNTERIELFAREQTPGWDCIGNEINGKDIKQELEEMTSTSEWGKG